MVFPSVLLMGLSLIPIVLLETWVLRRCCVIPKNALLPVVARANIVSTFIGIPIVWFLLVLIQMSTGGGYAYGLETAWQKLIAVTWQAPWLIPYEDGALRWIFFCAFLILMPPFFLTSVWVENRIISRRVELQSKRGLLKAVFQANAASYGLLVVVDVLFYCFW